MSAIHRLLGIGVCTALLASSGCQIQPAASVSVDSSRNDTHGLAVSEKEPVQEVPPVIPVREAKQIPMEDTIGAVTPSFRNAILEKKSENPDVAGWLWIPGTAINDPILQNPVENNGYSLKNNYYLNNNIDRQPDRNGTFCADYRASLSSGREGLSHTTALYGHSWDDDPDGALFSQIKKYRDPEFARETPYIYFSTEDADMAWEVIAVFDTTIYLPYILPNLSYEEFYPMLDVVYDLSYYNYGVPIWDDDRLLVLSTCTFSVDGHPKLPEWNEYRFVVMARLVEPNAPRKDQAVFAVNENRTAPDETRRLTYS